ncbi:hypothetical protein Tco_0555419, partial [Tanacetum coccineum]
HLPCQSNFFSAINMLLASNYLLKGYLQQPSSHPEDDLASLAKYTLAAHIAVLDRDLTSHHKRKGMFGLREWKRQMFDLRQGASVPVHLPCQSNFFSAINMLLASNYLLKGYLQQPSSHPEDDLASLAKYTLVI